MKKQRKNAGFSLIEMMCTLLILVLLVMAIGVGMDAGGRVYKEATFEAESATLAGILNTAMGDILRYCEVKDVLSATEQAELGVSNANFRFMCDYNYGVDDAYFYIPPHKSGGYKGVLKIMHEKDNKLVDTELVNTGAYPDLLVSDLYVEYHERNADGVGGGYFEIEYTISSASDNTKTRDVKNIVRLMND